MSLAVRGTIFGLLGSQILRVVYSDESGTGDNKQPIAVVTAIVLNMDSQWAPIERDLSAIKIRLIPIKLMHRGKGEVLLSTLTQNPELKGDRLFKGLRGKIHGVAPEKAVESLMHVLSVAVKHGVQIFHGAIDRAGRAEGQRAYSGAPLETDEQAALLECLSRLEGFVHTYMPNESVLWIADKSGFEKSVKHGLKFFQWIQGMGPRALRQLISAFAQERGIAIPAIPDFNFDQRPSHVVDTIYFGDSHESLALQLADVCCATIAQHLLGKQDAEPFYNIIRRQVVTDGNPVVYSDAWRGVMTANAKH
jgi:Protein of unknown function (DUF3800)